MPELNEVIEQLGTKFSQFRDENEKALAGLTEQVGELDGIKTRLDEMEAKSNRHGGAVDTEDAEYKTGFEQYIRKGDASGIEHKAVNTGTGAEGGFALPNGDDLALLDRLRDVNPMRMLCASIKISTAEYSKLVSLGGAGSGWVGETGARTATGTPSLAKMAASMGELYAFPLASQRSLDDLAFDVTGWIVDEAAVEFAEKEGAAFLTGDGVDKPLGLLAHTLSLSGDDTRAHNEIQKIHSGTSGDFDSDDLIDLVYSLKAGYRKNASFLMSSLTLAHVRKLKDGSGAYIWQPSAIAGQPSTLLGYPVYETDDMPAMAADSNAVVFADFGRAYGIVDRIGTQVLLDPYTAKPNVGAYITKRVGGVLLDAQAAKVLTLSL